MNLPPLFDVDKDSLTSNGAPPAASGDVEQRADELSPVTYSPAQTQSLYRKYRPQSFDAAELVGQEHIVRTLRNAIFLDRVAHAYLFCGPRGTGKTTTARLLAKAVNCLDPESRRRPCNECVNCHAVNRGATTDVIEIDAASNRGIDDIRDLRERVKYAPTQLSTKFYIIDEAHQITGAAANAFLKTLEEPPPHTKFVLATTDPEELLATIVSRCQRFDFRRINREAMIERLRTVASAEHLAVEDEALSVIARNATGSLRDALGLLDQLAVYRESELDGSTAPITAEAVRMVLGVSRNDRVETLVRALADRDARAALETVNLAVEAGEDPRQLNRQLVGYLRVLLHERAGNSPDADEAAKGLAKRFDLLRLAQLSRRFSEIDYRIRHSSYNQLPLEVALLESVLEPPTRVEGAGPRVQRETGAEANQNREAVASDRPTTTLRDRIRKAADSQERSDRVSQPAQPAPSNAISSPVQARSNGPAPPTGGLSVETIADLWPQIRQDVKAVNRRIEALLQYIDPVAIQGELITLSSPYEFHRNRLNADEVRIVLEDVISRILTSQVRVVCVLRGEEPPGSPIVAMPGPDPHRNETPSPPDSIGERVGADSAPEEPALSTELDEQRIQAAKNIFDAEEIGR